MTLSFGTSALCVLGALVPLAQGLPQRQHPRDLNVIGVKFTTAVAWNNGLRIYAAGTPSAGSASCGPGEVMEILGIGAAGKTEPTFSTNSNPCLSPPNLDASSAISASVAVDGNDNLKAIKLFYFTSSSNIFGYTWSVSTNSWTPDAAPIVTTVPGLEAQTTFLASTAYISNEKDCFSVYFVNSFNQLNVVDTCGQQVVGGYDCGAYADVADLRAISYISDGNVMQRVYVTTGATVVELSRSSLSGCALRTTPNFKHGVGAPYLAFNADGSQSGPDSSLRINYVEDNGSNVDVYYTSNPNLDWTDDNGPVTVTRALSTSPGSLTMAFAVDPNTTYNYVYGVFLSMTGNLRFFWRNSQDTWSKEGPVWVSN